MSNAPITGAVSLACPYDHLAADFYLHVAPNRGSTLTISTTFMLASQSDVGHPTKHRLLNKHLTIWSLGGSLRHMS